MNDRIYSELAERYARSSATGPVNALYDRPTILRLAGPISGRDVLELGCAAGYLTEQLVRGGARVTSFDKSEQMVGLARARVGDHARVAVADLNRPLASVADESMDVAVASLVLHYIPDWRVVLGEVFRALRPGGVFVLSLHHPVTGWVRSDQTDYHRVELIGETWDVEGVPVVAQMWRRPISAVFAPLLEQGFVIDAVEEPAPDFDEEDVPDARIRGALNATPVFLFVRVGRPDD